MVQDAHCGADLEHSILPNISLSGGHVRHSAHTNALCDLWQAMETAKYIIYITNWHFNPETKNPFDESLPNIGELLKRKSKEGKLWEFWRRYAVNECHTLVIQGYS